MATWGTGDAGPTGDYSGYSGSYGGYGQGGYGGAGMEGRDASSGMSMLSQNLPTTRMEDLERKTIKEIYDKWTNDNFVFGLKTGPTLVSKAVLAFG